MTAVHVRSIRSFLSIVCLGAGLGLHGTAARTSLADDFATGLTADLGIIDFPNSGAAEAQMAFLTGMKALHSFEFEDAGEAFREAQAIDPQFALAYWGEALSYNHPLWAEQDGKAALAALARFVPTPEARAQKAPAGRERGLMKAVASMIFGKMFWRVWRNFVPKESPGGLSFPITTLPLGGGKDHDGFLLTRGAGHNAPWARSG